MKLGKYKSGNGALRVAIMLLVVLSAPTFAGCGDVELASQWKSREVTVDGLDSEWDGARSYIAGAKGSIGVLNDDEYLYICLTTGHPDIKRQVMTRGFTLWFDPSGGKDRVFGIRFPVGMGGPNSQPMMAAQSMSDSTDMHERFRRMSRELEILGPGEGERREMLVATVSGIDVGMEVSEHRFTYELKIPIAKTEGHPFAIGTHAGDQIGVRFETPKPDREAMRENVGLRGGGRGGMGNGKGGGRGGRGGGMGGGRRPQMLEPLDLWARVQLASVDDGASGENGPEDLK